MMGHTQQIRQTGSLKLCMAKFTGTHMLLSGNYLDIFFLLRCFCKFGISDLDILSVLAFFSLNFFAFLVIILYFFFMVWNMSFVFLFAKFFLKIEHLKVFSFLSE